MNTKSLLHCSRFLGTCLVASIMPASLWAALPEDFQSDTVGAAPSGAHWITTGASVTVVDGNSTNADPFGGVGNQSMYINSAALSTYVVYKNDTAYTAGTFSIDLYGANVNSYTYVKLGNSSVSTGVPNVDTAVNLLIRWGSVFSSWDASNVSYNFDSKLLQNVAYSLVVTFDSSTEKWSATVNGTSITANSGVTTVFDYYNANSNSVLNVDRVSLYSPTASGGAMTYVDNISLAQIPEPSSALLVGAAAMLVAGSLRRRTLHG